MGAVEIITGSGVAQADLDGDGAAARFLLVLTHGAGGSVDAPDVLAARDAGLQLGGLAARVTQPYRVAGARAPGSAVRQDAAWVEIVAALRELAPGVPLVQGGRSNGARVVCRTAAELGARAVIALAFPLHPPQRLPGRAAPATAKAGTAKAGTAKAGTAKAGTAKPSAADTGKPSAADTGKPSAAQIRVTELRSARAGGAKVLVVNGECDPFGIPEAEDADRVVIVPRETHSLKGHRTEIVSAIAEWLPTVLGR
jgi:uncharacterized protein